MSQTEGYDTNPDDPAERVGISVSFTCKDPLLAKYYRNEFGPLIREKLVTVVEEAQRAMAAHAAKQEHFDYTLVDGVRVLMRDEKGEPLLLVPKVRITVHIGADRE